MSSQLSRAEIEAEFYSENKALAIQHVRHGRMPGDLNKMERFNGELGDREEARLLATSSNRILAGMQIYHNYVLPHMGLECQTPENKAGIQIKGKDKCLTLIQNTSKKKLL